MVKSCSGGCGVVRCGGMVVWWRVVWLWYGVV